MEQGKQLFSELDYCIRCCMPLTEEGAKHDDLGICRACQSSEQKMRINWVERQAVLKRLLDDARNAAGSNYDCILPISGGKDSTFQAHVLVNVYKMKPLAVTFSHNWYSETGWYNLMNLLETFNLDHVMFTPNRSLVNRLARKSVHEIGDGCWHCHMGCGSFPLQVAVRFRIPLVVYGEPAAESQGRTSYEEWKQHGRETSIQVSAIRSPSEMADENISAKDLHPFELPAEREFRDAGVQILHLGNFLFWDDERQTEFVRDVYGWRETEVENSIKRYKSAECVMPGIHDFTCYLKRGFGRATSQGSVDVRNGLLTRAEAFELIGRIDPTRPEALDYYLRATGMDEAEFNMAMSKLRRFAPEAGALPVHPKDHANAERILPFPLQLIERLKPAGKPFYEALPGAPAAPAGRLPAEGLFLGLSAKAITHGVASGSFSPTEIAREAVKRIERLDPVWQAFETFDPEVLMGEARQAEERLAAGGGARLLEGVPFAIKDIYNTAKLPTQMGSPIWAGFTPGNDARAVFNMLRAGALTAGKTTTAEFAVHALNKTLNPHDKARTPGTSSSGSAVAMALGLAPCALASQTAGSIVRPASFCGVWGMKPSFGLTPRTGTLKTTDSLDTLGFMTVFAEDLETVHAALRVHGPNYPFAHAALSDPARQSKPEGRPWKVALLKTGVDPLAEGHAREALNGWIASLGRTGEFEVAEMDLTAELSRAHEVHSTIYEASLAYYFQKEFKQAEFVSSTLAEMVERGRRVTREQYHRALYDQGEIIAAVDARLRGADVGVCLATAGHAPERGVEETPDSALMWTAAHLPVVAAPLFVSPAGLPFGAQFVARKYNDLLLLRFVDHLAQHGLVPRGPNPVANAVSSGGRAFS